MPKGDGPKGEAAHETRRRRRAAAKAATATGTPTDKELDREVRTQKAGAKITPRWWVVVMTALMVLGLVWIVVFYLSGTTYPVPGWGNWNLVAGFGLILVGFGMTTRWR